jgi:hypothetical protein
MKVEALHERASMCICLARARVTVVVTSWGMEGKKGCMYGSHSTSARNAAAHVTRKGLAVAE